MAHQEAENINYEVKAEQRKDSFIARTTSAISGTIAGIVSFKFFEKNALRKYALGLLNKRDVLNGALDEAGLPVAGADSSARVRELHNNVVSKTADTMSGAPAADAIIEQLRTLEPDKLKPFLGSTVGDPKANAAYHHLLTENWTLVEAREAAFKKEADKLLEYYHGKIQSFQSEYFADNSKQTRDAVWSEVASINKEFNHSRDYEARVASIGRLANEKGGLFKDAKLVYKFFEEYDREHANLLRRAHEAKQRLVEIPIIDEMIKHGKQPGRMGLKLRQVPKNERVLAMSAVTAVAVGAVAYKAVKSYLKRNDKDEQDTPSFQSTVTAQREAATDTAARTA